LAPLGESLHAGRRNPRASARGSAPHRPRAIGRGSGDRAGGPIG
jgi:hypothetical protein